MVAVIEWSTALSPTLEDFEQMAQAAFLRLPQEFRSRCEGLQIRIDDFADDDVLDDLEAESPYDILGLYQGVSLAGSDSAVAAVPNMVFLYRRPILDYWAEYEETLGYLITHVLVHEIGHHFGLSDADMERIEAAADGAKDTGPLAME